MYHAKATALGSLPLTLMIVGDEENMLDETVETAATAIAAGAQVSVSIYRNMWHVWPMYSEACDTGVIVEAEDAIDEIAQFVAAPFVPPGVVTRVRERAFSESVAKLAGGCLCGAVRYQTSQVLQVLECNCSMCRKASGSTSVTWASTSKRHLTLTTEDCYTTYQSSEGGRRGFCSKCGSTLTMDYFKDEPSKLKFRSN